MDSLLKPNRYFGSFDNSSIFFAANFTHYRTSFYIPRYSAELIIELNFVKLIDGL